jgi:hypothetical protein
VVESHHARVFAPVLEPHSRINTQQFLFMKPTPQISRKRHAGFPLTDYNYQPTADAKITAGRPVAKLTGFHKLSSDFIGTEMVRDYVLEFSAFTIIGLISAWPILSSIVAVARMAHY